MLQSKKLKILNIIVIYNYIITLHIIIILLTHLHLLNIKHIAIIASSFLVDKIKPNFELSLLLS
jgi:hypothetical protein